MNKNIIFIIILTNIFVAFLSVFLVREFYKNSNNSSEIRENGNYTFVSPLLECVNNISFYNPGKIKQNLDDFIDENVENKNISELSYYFQALKTGNNYSYNQEALFTPASLLKLPLAMSLVTYYSPEDLNNVSILQSKASTADRNIGSDTLSSEQSLTGQELLEKMLIESDNIAANSLFDFLGNKKIEKIYIDLGIIGEGKVDIFSQGITTKKFASFLRILFNASYLSPDSSEYILGLLSQSSYNDGLSRYIPGNVKIAHKFGERATGDSDIKQLHDCGIIYYPENPYILCVMTRGENFENMSEIIAELSRRIFNDIAQHKK